MKNILRLFCFQLWLLLTSLLGCTQKTGVEPALATSPIKIGALALNKCEALCNPDNPSYQCLILGTLGKERNTQIGTFIDRLSHGAGTKISHKELLSIFDIGDPKYADARGETRVDAIRLSNVGKSSLIKTATTSGLEFNLEVPQELAYAHFGFEIDNFKLFSESAKKSFYISIGDPILQRTFGGRVLEMKVAKQMSIFATENGCIAYDPTPDFLNSRAAKQLMKITRARLAYEQSKGESESHLQAVQAAYSRITPLREEKCIPEEEKCMECEEPGTVPCNTTLGTTCISALQCSKNGYRICGT